MSALLKVLFGIMMVVCVAQLIEAAPKPEETKVEDTANKLANDIADQLKKAFSEENLKQLVDTASKFIADGAKTFESSMKDLKDKVDHATEKKD